MLLVVYKPFSLHLQSRLQSVFRQPLKRARKDCLPEEGNVMLFGSKKSKRPRDPSQVTPQAAPVKPTKTPSQRRLVVTVTRTDIMTSIAEGTAASNNLLNALRVSRSFACQGLA